ncbi:MAG: CRISPR-associated endonuclease Cas2 [Phycisphaerales bacterium]|nr:CRISPR-associated endonuclease Cas2 [Phycisphaerales bacterium]
MHYLIAYDIADPRRLRSVAKRLEHSALRVQKSVFTFQGAPAELEVIFADLISLINVHEDCVQAWAMRSLTAARQWKLGAALPQRLLSVVVSNQGTMILEATI